MCQDLLLNLIAETIGIIVTVFLISRFQRRREEKRLLPSKHLVYGKLLSVTSSLLGILLRPNGGSPESSDEIWHFGLVNASPLVELKDSPELRRSVASEMLDYRHSLRIMCLAHS